MWGFGDKRQPCLPVLWRSVFKTDLAGFYPCSPIEPSPAIIINSVPLEISPSQGLLGYSPYGSRKDKLIMAESVLIFALLTHPCCEFSCLDRKMGAICMHSGLFIG